ncbi:MULTISPECIES: pirin family protein [Acinetobacter]|jgi:redox-sensitive bicupin YhaK (pirin superfamily)|uniref:pirin family protein n=1 Tax=Acinetobacter TaxID=469 RepID=UPI000EA40B87|nr:MULTISPECIES: pirin family protein [Acinetobacter]RKG43502.1 pirin family protein [Acinetobacter cumulans]RZG59397.1 pirin family protein [Acinetobacter sp. WCHAc060006]
MKNLAFIHNTTTQSAVGDFSPVTSVFSHYELGNTVSPFLLLDHLGPGTLKPTQLRKGVDEHPHRGFETVTIMFKGELEHRDTTGGGGVIYAGDVQWMTAASGIQHKEVFSEAFSKAGGPFEMLQLWVNLPAKDKMNPPRYQSLSNNSIPKVTFADDAGYVRVIAGEYAGHVGPAETHTPMQVYDVFIKKGQTVQLPAQAGDTTLIYMRTGRAVFAGSADELEDNHMAVMSSLGEHVEITALRDCAILYLSAAPLNEPIYGRGYFVMNSYEEILQCYEDLKNGTFIHSPAEGS